MSRRTTIVTLACMFYALQLALLYYWHALGTGGTFDLVLAGIISLVLAAIDAGAVLYLLQAMHRVEQLYATDISEELEKALESYRVLAAREAQLAQEIGHTVDDELARTREALAEGRLDIVDEHLRRGVDAASRTRGGYCDNVTVAAVLEVKARQCKEAGIGFSTQVEVPEDLPLPETEIAAVFFNLIDNALHECEKLATRDSDLGRGDEPTISVRARTQTGQLFIEVSNPCEPETGAQLAKAASTRMDAAREHGWGTHIVSDIAKTHGGIISQEVSDKLFISRVMIPLPLEEVAS